MSLLEDKLAYQLKLVGLPEPLREFRFHPIRRWRADFCWPDNMLIVEVEGATWTNGRHNRGSGFDADCEKYAEAVIIGYRVLRITSTHLKTGQAIQWIEKLLK